MTTVSNISYSVDGGHATPSVLPDATYPHRRHTHQHTLHREAPPHSHGEFLEQLPYPFIIEHNSTFVKITGLYLIFLEFMVKLIFVPHTSALILCNLEKLA